MLRFLRNVYVQLLELCFFGSKGQILFTIALVEKKTLAVLTPLVSDALLSSVRILS
jgi:hypothetical protein